jgi:hypothetical protein
MKRLLFFISVFILINISTYGQNVYTGKIIGNGNPCPPPDDEFPCVPGMALWLKTTSIDYVLSLNSHWIWDDKIIVDGVEYFEDDEVEITGQVTTWVGAEEYFIIEIETIKKLPSSSIEPLLFNPNKVYYDATEQIVVIDETLQNQSLTFELVDAQGKRILQTKVNSTNNLIQIKQISNGVYFYYLLHNGQVVYSGKILK